MSHLRSRLHRRRPPLQAAARTGTVLALAGTISVGSLGLASTSSATASPPTVFLSDLRPTATTGGWGPVEVDRSNGDLGRGDGGVLTIEGRTAAKGLGAHAGSEISFEVPDGCTTFISSIGVDDEVGQRGSVRFAVEADGSRVFLSRLLTGRDAGLGVTLQVTPGTSLRLVVTDGGDGRTFDHADWAGAAFLCTQHDAAALAGGAGPGAPGRTDVAEAFDGADGEFVSSRTFWSRQDRGTGQNPTWFSDSGQMLRKDRQGRTRADFFRMWTRQSDLQHVTAELDVTFNGFTGGTAGWHGINLWLHKQMCVPVPSCSAVQDPSSGTGNSGYALDLFNRDGSLTILKKVSGDARARYPGAVSHAQGGTYYQLARTSFAPVAGRRYGFVGRSIDNGDGSTTLQVLVDGRSILSVRDDGRVGGPRLGAGRVGLRSDFVDMTVDNFFVYR